MKYYWIDRISNSAYVDEATGEIIAEVFALAFGNKYSFNGRNYISLEAAKRAVEKYWSADNQIAHAVFGWSMVK